MNEWEHACVRSCVYVRFSSLSISFLSVAPKKDCYRQLFWIVISTQIDFNVVTLIKSVNDLSCCVRRCVHVYWRPKDVNNHYFEWSYGVYFLIGIDGVFCFKTYEIQFIHSTWLSFIVNCHTAPDMLSDALNANVFKTEVICGKPVCCWKQIFKKCAEIYLPEYLVVDRLYFCCQCVETKIPVECGNNRISIRWIEFDLFSKIFTL